MNLLWFNEKCRVVTPKLALISALTEGCFSLSVKLRWGGVCVLLPGA